MTKWSVIIPAKDEDETLGRLLEDLNNAIAALEGYDAEPIRVDDRFRDRTAATAGAMGAQVAKNRRKPGKGKAPQAGFGAAGDRLSKMDADTRTSRRTLQRS